MKVKTGTVVKILGDFNARMEYMEENRKDDCNEKMVMRSWKVKT